MAGERGDGYSGTSRVAYEVELSNGKGLGLMRKGGTSFGAWVLA